jgi:hypothetical protein
MGEKGILRWIDGSLGCPDGDDDETLIPVGWGVTRDGLRNGFLDSLDIIEFLGQLRDTIHRKCNRPRLGIADNVPVFALKNAFG